MHKTHYVKLFSLLLALCIFGVMAIFPYVVTVQRSVLAKIPVSLSIIFIVQLFQSIVIFALAILVGLKLYKKVGLSLPIFEAIVVGKKYLPHLQSIGKISFMSGILAGGSITILDYLFRLVGVNVSTEFSHIPLWQRLLVGFYGGINEEVLMRLFLMTLVIWMGVKVIRQTSQHKTVIWTSIILTSIIFGLGHLPIVASVVGLTFLVVLRTIVLNSIGGIIFGWLFWKRGLEAAMIAHFIADIVLHVIIPLITGSM